MYQRIKELAAKQRSAKTAEEREYIKAEMLKLEKEDSQAYGEALERLIAETSQKVEELTMFERMGEVTDIVSMAYISNKYFGKSRCWLSQRLHGNMVNGKKSGLNKEEVQILKSALYDISQKIGSLSASL